MQFAGFINFSLFIFRFEFNFCLESHEMKEGAQEKKIYMNDWVE